MDADSLSDETMKEISDMSEQALKECKFKAADIYGRVGELYFVTTVLNHAIGMTLVEFGEGISPEEIHARVDDIISAYTGNN